MLKSTPKLNLNTEEPCRRYNPAFFKTESKTSQISIFNYIINIIAYSDKWILIRIIPWESYDSAQSEVVFGG